MFKWEGTIKGAVPLIGGMRMNKQSVNSDASDVEGALTQSGQESGPAPKTENKLASNDPKTMAGYEKLGVAGPAHTGKPTATDNRGEGY